MSVYDSYRDINEQVLYTANIGKGQLQIGDKKYIEVTAGSSDVQWNVA